MPLQRTPHDIRDGDGGKLIQWSREHPQEVLRIPAHVVTRGSSAKVGHWCAENTRCTVLRSEWNGGLGRVLWMFCNELLDVNAFALVQADVFQPVKCL